MPARRPGTRQSETRPPGNPLELPRIRRSIRRHHHDWGSLQLRFPLPLDPSPLEALDALRKEILTLQPALLRPYRFQAHSWIGKCRGDAGLGCFSKSVGLAKRILISILPALFSARGTKDGGPFQGNREARVSVRARRRLRCGPGPRVCAAHDSYFARQKS